MTRRFCLVLLCALVLAACSAKEDTLGAPPPIPAPRDVAAPPADALKTPSGIASKVLRVGLGSIHPKPTSSVRVHYTGWTTDGNMFDSSVARNDPATFTLDQVIPGWTEALQLMVVGEKRRFWIPGSLGYGDLTPGGPKTTPLGQPLGMLVFDIELLDLR